VKTFDNSGKLVAETTQARTSDGRSISTITQYDTYSGRPVHQNITVRETNGKVTTTNVINGKLLP
jgi:hypothetical protein